MKNAIIGIVVFIVVVGGIRLIAKGGQYQYAEYKVNKGETYQAPKDFKAEMLEGCVTEATEANRSFCVCAVDHLQASVGDVRLQAMGLEYVKTNVTPPEMETSVYACIDKYVEV